jgi:hypothetical protein
LASTFFLTSLSFLFAFSKITPHKQLDRFGFDGPFVDIGRCVNRFVHFCDFYPLLLR